MDAQNRDRAMQLLERAERGDRTSAEQLIPLVYDRLHDLAEGYLRNERSGHTLQPTALVHEAYLLLADQSRISWKGKTHFFAAGAGAMRRILVDHARRRRAQKRGGGANRFTLPEGVVADGRPDQDILAVDEALNRLAEIDPRQAQIVELRFFGGLTVDEVAEVLGVSKRTVEREWTVIRAWLRRELSHSGQV